MDDVTAEPAPAPRDVSEVGHAAARTAWAEAARPVLEEAAGRYRSLVRFKALSDRIQATTGITTTRPVATWIGGVLGDVADGCAERGEPLLSALCVSAQGGVSDGYAAAVERARGVRPEDPDAHAADERLACYQHWQAAGLPGDGGTALRTAHFTPTRKAAPRQAAAPRASRAATPRKAAAPKKVAAPKPEEKPVRLCPTCFTAVPASGICDYCD